MRLREAKQELLANINAGYSHAVLLRDGRGYKTELHPGHAGNCCCNEDEGYVWSEQGPYTDPAEIREITT